jgi:murein tripeptide amidase MpaA
MSTEFVQYPDVATTAAYDPTKYYRYAEMAELLHGWRAAYPGLMSVESIGRSYEGREIWGVTLTNGDSGPANEKPAYHIDANIHAGEVTGSAVVLYTIHWLLTNYGQDRRATFVLDHLTLYLVPRICVDGAELFLTTATDLRSSVRPYGDHDERDGLRESDLNGDGLITLMRVPDPAGAWKKSAQDDRLMVLRAPDEVDGDFYRLYPEGEIAGPADGAVPIAPTPYGLDLNRNFPIAWVPDSEQPGAGPYPFSEPEIRALADWMLGHPNVSGSQHYHTHGGIIIRPSSFRPDTDLPEHDARVFQALGRLGTEETGYSAVSLWEGFTPNAERRKGGTKNTDLDWVYERLGVYAFTTELWNLYLEAGVPVADYDFIGERPRPEAFDSAALAWADRQFPNQVFVPWQPFDHPRLGAVEIGGWNGKFGWVNPPGDLLPELCHRNMRFTLGCASAAPRVQLRSLRATRETEGVWRIRAVAENVGFLPTWVSEQARLAERAKPVMAELDGPNLRLLAGRRRQVVGDLSGRSGLVESFAPWSGSENASRQAIEWVVAGDAGSEAVVSIDSPSGGVSRQSLRLE